MKIIVALILLFSFIVPQAAIALDEDMEREGAALEDGIPDGYHRRGGVHFKREYKLDAFHESMHHTLPEEYVKKIPKGKRRSGLEEHMMVGFYSNFRSKYMSKEQPDSKGPVWQPSATIEAYGLGLNVWANFVLNDEANQGEFNEVDFTPYYTAHIGNLTIHPYLMFMVFPNGDPRSLDYSPEPIIETDLHVDYTLWRFNLFGLMRAQAKGSSPGSIYANVGVGYNHPIHRTLTMQTSALLNMGNDIYLTSKYGPKDTNIDAMAFMLAFAWSPLEGLTFKPNVQATVHVVPSIRRVIDTIPDNHNEIVWGGLDIAFEL